MLSENEHGNQMKPVCVTLTDEVMGQIDRLPGDSRSGSARLAVAAVLEGCRRGDHGPFDLAANAARATGVRGRRQKPDVAWRKAILWFPVPMLEDLAAIAREDGLKTIDTIRGILVWASGTAPLGNLAAAPHDEDAACADDEDSQVAA